MNILSNLDNDSLNVDIYDYINSDLPLEKKKEIVTKVIRLITMDVINSRKKIITIHPKKGNPIQYRYDRYSMKCKTYLIKDNVEYPILYTIWCFCSIVCRWQLEKEVSHYSHYGLSFIRNSRVPSVDI